MLIVAIALAVSCRRRAAAVGRIEMSTFFLFYGIVQALQFLDTGSIFQQGELAITVITAVHLGFVVGL